MITDEKLKSLSDNIVKHCPSCGSPNVSVRRAKDGWFYVGCEECWQKNQSDEAMLEYAIEVWNRRAQGVGCLCTARFCERVTKAVALLFCQHKGALSII